MIDCLIHGYTAEEVVQEVCRFIVYGLTTHRTFAIIRDPLRINMPLYTSSSSARCGIPDMISIRSSLDQLAELGPPSGTTLSQLNPQLSLFDNFGWINQLTEMILAVCSPGRVTHLDLLLRAAANHPSVHQFPAVHEAAILGLKSLRAWIQRESSKSRVTNLSSH